MHVFCVLVNGHCPGGVPLCPGLSLQEAVAGAQILGAMSGAATGIALPQAVMAAQAPGVITGMKGRTWREAG